MANNDVSDLIEEDLRLAPPEEKLRTIADLAEQQLDLEAEIADLQLQLAGKAAELKQISERDIPSAMTAAGVQSFTLSSKDLTRTGSIVTVKPDVSVSLSGSVKFTAISWLKQEGHDDIISSEMIVKIPKGFDAIKVETLRETVSEVGLFAKEEENVNTATFKSLYNEQKGKGVEFTLDGRVLEPKDLGAYHYTRTDIKLPKAKTATKRASKTK